MDKKRLSKIIKITSISVLTLFAIFWFVFALLSGAKEYGGGLTGIIKNSPNAIPWALLFGLVYLAHKKEKIGGYTLITLGVLTVFMFDGFEEPFVLIVISLPIILLGSALVYSKYLKT